MTATPESKHTHTAGPWSVDDEACFVFGRDGHMVAELRGVGVKRTEGEIAANGELIAAAPALLEALKEIREGNALMAEGEGDEVTIYQEMAAHWMKRADEALALAEGRGN